jgi:3alpha(or 20beta)-hydroxysteroid dehydrogenase
MGRLDGKVALVTGAARGMGQAEARLFAREGARVVVADVLDDEGAAVANEIGPAARFQHLDVASETGWAAAIAAATGAFGRLDVLVNNAGIVIPSLLRDLSLENWRRVIDVNQTGVFLGMRAAIPALEAAGGGSIVNVSSIDGLIGMDLVFAYVASKFAVRGMTKTGALELALLGIRVNSLHPGFVHTRMGNPAGDPAARTLLDRYGKRRIPLGRPAEPQEIANLALFLASDESSYCTGSEFVADGGFTAGEPLPRGTD